MDKEDRINIACELIRIAAEMSPQEELALVEGMNNGQLINFIWKHKGNYTSLPKSTRTKDFGDMIDTSKPMRSMSITEMLRNVAKMGIDTEEN